MLAFFSEIVGLSVKKKKGRKPLCLKDRTQKMATKPSPAKKRERKKITILLSFVGCFFGGGMVAVVGQEGHEKISLDFLSNGAVAP